eukprot:COSAG02_NODE_1480_length_12399_cov_250.195935_12_plen_166_part_00
MLLVQFGNGTSEMLPELGLEVEAAAHEDSTNAVAIEQVICLVAGLAGPAAANERGEYRVVHLSVKQGAKAAQIIADARAGRRHFTRARGASAARAASSRADARRDGDRRVLNFVLKYADMTNRIGVQKCPGRIPRVYTARTSWRWSVAERDGYAVVRVATIRRAR